MKSFKELSLKKLLAKVRDLRDDLDIAQAEVTRKTSDVLPPRLPLDRAATAPFGDRIASQRFTTLSKCRREVESDATCEGESSSEFDTSSSRGSLTEAVLGPRPLLLLKRMASA
jgi:hypothetical protein